MLKLKFASVCILLNCVDLLNFFLIIWIMFMSKLLPGLLILHPACLGGNCLIIVWSIRSLRKHDSSEVMRH